ncbi:hypothetical protein SAMN05661080_01085 [Modestobacter sp. DSM 44400]|uniref:hypothetical protein n=1 Tax=Modestobacter sp. DSM 44400 TaxID=1550230 RepID=UPI0008997BD1|nr:hypothetical protein [Modestobacter sp. DSM 44400]SDX75853.1 hypothetical protein SAMN05661080_01085 [Modestobacter sp. DSM 44400]
MSKRVVVAGVVWVVVTVLAFLVDPILGSVVGIFGATGVVVLSLGNSWDRHPDFEERELDRSRRRAAKKAENWDKNADVRERDRARYTAHQAKLAVKAEAKEARRQSTERRAS